MTLEKSLEKFFEHDTVPLKSNEVVCLTRVVFFSWKSVFHSSKVFPTSERAYDFALLQEKLVIVQPVSDPVPPQPHRTNKSFTMSRRGSKRK